MSAEIEGEGGTCCASCGVTECDDNDVKLKHCAACHLVKYCGVKCQKNHRPKHKRACKQRAAELHDEVLFRQPECSCFGDCPICFLPLPIDSSKSSMHFCCSKVICNGCEWANVNREIEEKRTHIPCPFCRQPTVELWTEACTLSEEASEQRLKDRADKMNDPVAMCQVGFRRNNDEYYEGAFEFFFKAAELGDATAHAQLAYLYLDGHGVEKDESKGVHHLEQAAIGGHPEARQNLGCFEWHKGRRQRAVKHFIIAAKLGCDASLKCLKTAYFEHGVVSEDDFAAALRGHQAAVDATKSPQRDFAEAMLKRQY